MAYATVADLTDYLGHTPDGAQRLLDRASRLIDQTILTARYGPDDSAVLTVLRDACLEQCAEWDEAGADGTDAGDPSQWSSVSAGSIALSRASRPGGSSSGSAGAGTSQRLGSQAWMILHQAGLAGQPARVGWW